MAAPPQKEKCGLKYVIYTFSRRVRSLDNNDVLTFALDEKSQVSDQQSCSPVSLYPVVGPKYPTSRHEPIFSTVCKTPF